ncbi:MAG TPA: ribbon-helix-helix domain-containing protein [Coleofasciculaceae cyanobacterium]
MGRFWVRVPDELHKQIEEQCEDLGWNKSKFIIEAVKSYLDKPIEVSDSSESMSVPSTPSIDNEEEEDDGFNAMLLELSARSPSKKKPTLSLDRFFELHDGRGRLRWSGLVAWVGLALLAGLVAYILASLLPKPF